LERAAGEGGEGEEEEAAGEGEVEERGEDGETFFLFFSFVPLFVASSAEKQSSVFDLKKKQYSYTTGRTRGEGRRKRTERKEREGKRRRRKKKERAEERREEEEEEEEGRRHAPPPS
jgi:hypothetical protein